eukprot:m51a1_g886 putative alpha-mannosidase 2-like (334) ;mRNA; r:161-1455
MPALAVLALLVAVAHAGTQGPRAPVDLCVAPLSHVDPGWRTTFEELYHSHMRAIIESVLQSLWGHEDRRFSWGEVSTLARWLEDEEHRSVPQGLLPGANGTWGDVVRTLVQFELSNAGWVQPDEACVTLAGYLGQADEGGAYLRRHGLWRRDSGEAVFQADPFGHSSLAPALLPQLGVGAAVLNRASTWDTRSRLQAARSFRWTPWARAGEAGAEAWAGAGTTEGRRNGGGEGPEAGAGAGTGTGGGGGGSAAAAAAAAAGGLWAHVVWKSYHAIMLGDGGFDFERSPDSAFDAERQADMLERAALAAAGPRRGGSGGGGEEGPVMLTRRWGR